MHLDAKKVYKRCMEKVKLPRKIQCNKDYNNTPLSYGVVQKRGVFLSFNIFTNPIVSSMSLELALSLHT